MKFNLTYNVTTEESAQHGDYQWHGFLPKSQEIPHRTSMPKKPATFTLRECVEILCNLKGYEPVEANQWPRKGFEWLTVSDFEGYQKDYNYQISLHLPDSMSDATKERIFQLIDNN